MNGFRTSEAKRLFRLIGNILKTKRFMLIKQQALNKYLAYHGHDRPSFQIKTELSGHCQEINAVTYLLTSLEIREIST